MAARNRWQTCLSDEEDKQARAILRQHSLSASELLRECFAFTVEHTPDFRVMNLQIERTDLEKRLKANLGEFETLTKGTTLAEIPPIELPNRRPRTSNSLTSKPKTDHEDFLHHVGNLGCGGKLGELAARGAKAYLEKHPDWTKDLPPEKYRLLIEPEGSQ
jgi:hypothetical protein